MIAPGSSNAFSPNLPPIPEQEWDFGWEETMFPLPDPYEGFEQAPTTTFEPAANDNTPPRTHEQLAKLQDEVRQLRHDIIELHGMFCRAMNCSLQSAKRLDTENKSNHHISEDGMLKT
ncbi:hypothetical protein J4E91_011143 [Alternaria rosae]|nr:hypothetical protein J4E91_011143 [Alternaria rosae]